MGINEHFSLQNYVQDAPNMRFSQKGASSYKMWLCGSYALECNAPLIMGVVNLHPASFVKADYRASVEASVAHALKMIEEGAAILDLGAEPTNPATDNAVSAEEELVRLLPVLRQLIPQISVPISVDTSQPEVMRIVLEEGASIINDTRALQDINAMKEVAATKAGVCLMYRGGGDIQTVRQSLKKSASDCIRAGIVKERIVLDPGIGNGYFGKTTSENLALLKQLSVLCAEEYPILVGVSRKTFIGDVLGIATEERLAGSLAAAVMAYQQGARILRVHDVAPTVHTLKIIQAIGLS